MNELDAAYLAGLIDGEGYIGAKRRLPTPANHMVSPRYSVVVSVSMTDREPLDLLVKFCGEPFVKLRIEKRAEHYKTMYRFDLEHDRAANLLRCIFPHLRAKKRQATLALQLADLRLEARKHRTKPLYTLTFKAGVNTGGEYRVLGLSDEFVAECDAIYSQLKRGSPRSGCGDRFHA